MYIYIIIQTFFGRFHTHAHTHIGTRVRPTLNFTRSGQGRTAAAVKLTARLDS